MAGHRNTTFNFMFITENRFSIRTAKCREIKTFPDGTSICFSINASGMCVSLTKFWRISRHSIRRTPRTIWRIAFGSHFCNIKKKSILLQFLQILMAEIDDREFPEKCWRFGIIMTSNTRVGHFTLSRNPWNVLS